MHNDRHLDDVLRGERLPEQTLNPEQKVGTGDETAPPPPPRAAGVSAPAPARPHYHPDALSLLGDVLQQPKKAFAHLALPHVEQGGLAVLVYVISQMPANWYRHPFGIPVDAVPLRVIGNGAAAILGLAFTVLLLHGFARMLGGRNTFGKLFQSMAFATLPALLTAPFQLIGQFTQSETPWLIANLVAGGWTFVLEVIALREVYRFSTGRALGAIALLFVAFAVLMLGYVVLFTLLGIGGLSEMLGM